MPRAEGGTGAEDRREPGPSLMQMALYFLRLGALGFGGPVALANTMRKDLAEERHWLTEQEYEDGLAIAAACPGPLAYQLGVYCGYIRHGVAGGLAVAVAFSLAPFALVVTAAWAYTRFSATWQLRALFYGVAPVVVALILKACFSLGHKMLRKDLPAWVVAVLVCAITVVVQKELTAIFLVAGALGTFVFAPRPAAPAPGREVAPPSPGRAAALGVLGSAGGAMTSKLFLFFFKTGFLVFGSGLVIVPFLEQGLVQQFGWLDQRQFLIAVAIGMISPGPVVITATFVGYLVAGFWGSVVSTVGIFLPSFLLVLIAAPLLARHRGNPNVQGFVKGAYAAAIGTILGACILLGRIAIGDWLTALIGLVSLAVLFRWKVSNPLLIAVTAGVGLIAYPLLQPTWVMVH